MPPSGLSRSPKGMGECAARNDAEGKKAGKVIPFADLQIGVTALDLGIRDGNAECEAFCHDSGTSDNNFVNLLQRRGRS